MTPTMFGIGAGVITVIAGVLSLPGSFPNLFETNDVALAMTTRGWLRVQAWAVFVASLVLLVVGLKVWTLTLDEKDNILAAYTQTSPNTIEALEERVEPQLLKYTYPSLIVVDSSTVLHHHSLSVPMLVLIALPPQLEMVVLFLCNRLPISISTGSSPRGSFSNGKIVYYFVWICGNWDVCHLG